MFAPLTFAQLPPAISDRHVLGERQASLPVRLLSLFTELGE